MSHLIRLCSPHLTLLFLSRLLCVSVSLWLLLSRSYLLSWTCLLGTVYLTRTLLSSGPRSLRTSLLLDTTLESWTYPQGALRGFFVVRDFKVFPENINYSVISRPIYILLDNIVERFILVWHSDITQSKSFPRKVRLELVSAIHQGYYRCGLINKYDFIQYLLDVYLVRLQEVVRATPQAFTQISHSAALTQQAQDQYVRALCDLIMRVSVSRAHYECEALRAVLREILSTQLFTRLLEMFSEPSMLYEIILDLVESETEDDELPGISDDDKEFLRNKPSDQKCFEIISDQEPDVDDEKTTTIQFGSMECSPGERRNKFRIPKVRLFGEGLTRFAVYVIEYSDSLWNAGAGDEIAIHLVGRRFKEFAALHERLLKDKATKAIAKKVNFPSKEPLSSFPFNRLDREFLSSRRDLFTQYLNEICQHEVVLAGNNLREFLGYQVDEITVFRVKSPSFIESKFGNSISKILKSFTRSLSLSDSRADAEDEGLLDIETEMYASYRESVRRSKKLTSLSRDHAKFLRAPPQTDINDYLDQYIRRKMEGVEKGPLVPTPTGYYNPDNKCVSIRDSRFCQTLLDIIQLMLSKSDTIMGTPGLAALLTTLLRLPVNRYFINKINLLTSEVYWFVYLTKLNQVLFERKKEEKEEGCKITKEEFMRRLGDKLGRGWVMGSLNVDRAVEIIAESLADQRVNKSMLLLLVDKLLVMFVPELEDELRCQYRM